MDAEIAIAGAGPAGTSAAIALAELGHRVAIYERAFFPRHRIGESLPPKIGAAFALLGVAESMASAAFVRMSGTTVELGDGPRTHDFDPAHRAFGVQADRARFDQILLDRARALGVRVFEGAHVTGVVRGDGGAVHGLSIRKGGVEERIEADFVVDATGTASIVARALGLKKRESIHTVALSRYYQDCATPSDFPAENTLFEMRANGWLWSVLLQDGRRNLTVGLDASELKGGHASLESIFAEHLEGSALIAPLVQGASVLGEISVHDATWSFAERYVGPGFLLAGDAGSFIDPLTSQGVYKAMCSGIYGAAAINTMLRRPGDARMAADFYQDLQRRAHRRYTDAALALYRTSPHLGEPFWRARMRSDAFSSPDDPFSAADFEAGRARKEAFMRRIEDAGGAAMRVRARPALRIVDRPMVQGGFVVMKPSIAAEDPTELEPWADATRVDVEKLLPLLDGRTLADVLEGYVAAAGRGRSTAEAKSLLEVLGGLAEADQLAFE